MAIPMWVVDVVRPVAELIDKFTLSKEEKKQLELQMLGMQITLVEKALDYESQLFQAKRDVIVAEAKGESWLQRSWRPLLMLVFATIVAWQYLIRPILSAIIPGLPVVELPEHLWSLLEIGVGGYIIGRSGEKIASALSKRNGENA
ncbi:MAG: holin family protein [Candidatus Methanomethylicaceae archaeon]